MGAVSGNQPPSATPEGGFLGDGGGKRVWVFRPAAIDTFLVFTVNESDVIAELRAAGCVFAEDEAAVLLSAARSAAELSASLERRVGGEPLEHIVGWADFCGLRIRVDPGVFVPRRRTQLLAREAIGLARSGSVVVDMCCGTGAVGVTVSAAISARVFAVDIDPGAVTNARKNLPDHMVLQGDLYEPLPARLRKRVNVVVANAPYVPTGAIPLMPAEAREHEARVALDGGADGLAIQRRVVDGAPDWLSPGGYLLIETSREQAPGTETALTTRGFQTRVSLDDDIAATVVIGRWPPA